MGPSVFHGAFSTLIIVLVVGCGKSFFFEIFFKTWLPMIIFGYLNGIILQPILLSLVGPTYDLQAYEEEEKVQELGSIGKIGIDKPSAEEDYDSILE